MKLKTVKGKLLAGVLAVGVVSSVGIAFANTDAGAAISNWYDGMFKQTTASVESQVTEYAEGFLPELEEEYENRKDHIDNSVNVKKNAETFYRQGQINEAKDGHLESLESEKEEIIEKMGAKFYNEVFLPGHAKIQDAAAEGLEYATNGLTSFSEVKGQDAVEQMTEELNTAKENAVSELEEAIRNAKEEITAKLDEEEQGSVYGLSRQVDIAVNNLQQDVIQLVKDLVDVQHTIIAETGEEITNNAKSALDEVVAGIDN